MMKSAVKRGARRKAATKAQGLGDCIDCKLCVHVCPTGIDIRDGLQIACISCAACIDACDDVMLKVGYPKGLISYTTEHNLAGQKTKVMRPRLIGYATALLIMSALFSYTVFNRTLVELNVLKDRTPYRENQEARIENVYTLKIMNKDQKDHIFVIEASGLDGLTLHGKHQVAAAAGEILSVPVSLSVDPEDIPTSTNTVEFTIYSEDDSNIRRTSESRFLGPTLR